MPSARNERPAAQGKDMEQRRSSLLAAFLAPARTSADDEAGRFAQPASAVAGDPRTYGECSKRA
jgi:hypothetical protein